MNSLLITSLKDYYFENSINKKIKKYSRYLLIKNKIIFYIKYRTLKYKY